MVWIESYVGCVLKSQLRDQIQWSAGISKYRVIMTNGPLLKAHGAINPIN